MIFIALLLATSCKTCKDCEEKEYYFLAIPSEVKALFPFEMGSTFTLSKGDTTIKYTCDSTSFKLSQYVSRPTDQMLCDPSDNWCNYFTQEINRIYFTGINQHTQNKVDHLWINVFNLAIRGMSAEVYSDLFSKTFTIDFNKNNYEDLYILTNDSTGIDTFYSTYTLNGKTYRNVNVLSYGFQDTLWYSSDQGFLKIINGNRKFERVPD